METETTLLEKQLSEQTIFYIQEETPFYTGIVTCDLNNGYKPIISETIGTDLTTYQQPILLTYPEYFVPFIRLKGFRITNDNILQAQKDDLEIENTRKLEEIIFLRELGIDIDEGIFHALFIYLPRDKWNLIP